mmetsp:Transcript_16257/g.18411  ORF Transcript_16257/g.18411 Transcript_16257/m.18411 type:complete len:509 (-) Transcript_16257:133-1659(-)
MAKAKESMKKVPGKGKGKAMLSGGILISIGFLVAIVGILFGDDPSFLQNLLKAITGDDYFPAPGVKIRPQDTEPERPFSFTVHYNGDGLGNGVLVKTDSYTGLDDMLQTICQDLIKDIDHIDASQCSPSNGAKLFTHEGIRCYSFLDISPGGRTYVVPQGILFVWPLAEVGHVIYPKSVRSPIPDKPIKLTQLSQSPRVFSVDNFMTPEEMESILEYNRERVKPSEVGLSGWRDSTRTSSTSWDNRSPTARVILRRAYDVIALQKETQNGDSVQILRYENNEWYKPHVDWFNEKSYDDYDPTVNNGTNRFVTVFLYLSDVEEGGHTVFPLSTTHEGYNGERLVHDGTVNTPGYIHNDDAKWVCNTSSSALRSNPKAGNAVIFYSQGPSGELDPYSLHGGCPVIKGVKWSANVWIWNRPRADKSKAKDKKTGPPPNSITVSFKNVQTFPISLFWDNGTPEMVKQVDLAVNGRSPMTTYKGHRFVARGEDGMQVAEYTAQPTDDGKVISF